MKKRKLTNLDRAARIAFGACFAVAAVGLMIWQLLDAKIVQAATLADCLSLSGAASVPSVQRACSNCPTSGVALGTMWINGSPTEKNSAIVTVPSASTTEMDVYLWGQVYSCTTVSSGTNTAYYIWFGEEGHDTGDSAVGYTNEVDFLRITGSNTLSRGTAPGAKYKWYTPSNNKLTVKLDVQRFLNYSGTTCTAPDATGKKTCRAKVSVNRCFSNTYGKYLNPASGHACYGDDSEITVEVPATEAVGVFGAYSWVQTASGGTVQTTIENSTVETTATTTDAHVDVTFWHQMVYNGPAYVPAGSHFDATSSNWTVKITRGGSDVTSLAVPDATHGGFNGTMSVADGGQRNLWSTWYGKNTIGVDVPDTGSIKVCSKIDFNPKNIVWRADAGTNNFHEQERNDADSSSACITLSRAAVVEEGGGQIRFWSNSTVDIPAQNGDVSHHTETADNKQTVIAKLSTDKDQLKVNFWHNLFYTHEGVSGGTPGDTMPSDICTQYTVTRSGDRGSATVTGPTDFCTSAHSSGEEVSRTNDFLISGINVGDTVKVCEKITYVPEIVYLKRTKHETLDAAGNVISYYWEYSTDGSSGYGFSEACVEVTRPKDPESEPHGVSYSTGATNADPMFAGETSRLGYDLVAQGYPTRRLMNWRVNTFQVKVSKLADASAVVGNIGVIPRTNIDPCAYYVAKFGSSYLRDTSGVYCAQVVGGSLGAAGRSTLHQAVDPEFPFIVPNLVGDKVCITAGYSWAYWYGVERNGSTTWTNEGRDYWTNYNAACATIAKKPTLELWNGGLAANHSGANVLTSLAYRANPSGGSNPATERALFQNYYSMSNTNPFTTTGRAYHAFGSWAEDLVTVGGNITNFSSGAQTALGADSRNLIDLSPLTIANTGTIGQSGIDVNSAGLERLILYFTSGDLPSSIRTSSLASLTTINPGETRIYTGSGTTTIDHDIKTTGTANIIQDVPQVVIYVDGDINITPDVEQIDAWLIATGKITTCYTPNMPLTDPGKNTAAVVNGAPAADTVCSKSLTINGPVYASSVVPRRTYGADGISNDDANLANNGLDTRAASAEIFNLSADTYIWSYVQANRYRSSYNDTYTREMPPRY